MNDQLGLTEFYEWVVRAPCESPLERHMLVALLWSDEFDSDEFTETIDKGVFGLGPHKRLGRKVILMQQAKMGPYRVDFMLLAKHDDRDEYSAIVIECDGHDYHERTKKQARRDRTRDRWFQAQGIPVFRFTGSEIWREPKRCADEAVNSFLDLTVKKWAA